MAGQSVVAQLGAQIQGLATTLERLENRLENVAEVLPYGQAAYSPGPARPEQFFFKDAEPVELDFGG